MSMNANSDSLFKTALAPMATLSHEALRLLIHRFGDPDEYYTEMIHAPSLLSGGKFEKYYVRTAPCPGKLVWQLTGPDAPSLCRAAGMVLRLGGLGVDLNMGCPAPAIVRTGAGFSWMLKPREETAGMVRSVRKVVDSFVSASRRPRLSVKLRIGQEPSYEKLYAFCSMLVESGVDSLTLHPRLQKDKYSRPARWDFVSRLSSDLPVPVFGNGDVFSAEEAVSVLRKFPCAGVMIGRGAVRKPWIFRDIRNALDSASGAASCCGFPAPEGKAGIDFLETAGYFLKCLEETQPPEFFVTRAHRFFSYYCDNFYFAHYIRTKILNAVSFDEIMKILASYFDENPSDRFKKP